MRRRWRDVGARTARRRLPLLAIVGPARRSLGGIRLRDGDVGLRRVLEDPVEAGRHSLGIIAVVVTVAAIILIGGFFFRLPPLRDFARRVSKACRVRFFFFSFFLSKSFADFSFSMDSRLLS